MAIRSEVDGRWVEERVYTGLENMKNFLNNVADKATIKIDQKQRRIIDREFEKN